ncbi:sulfide/dihydroorotate dehydrogenase-like FAD/NAD-binding protein [Allobaculum stercoricanis]|uniref:sulfide/dihydroorotate dehydrogenase-like FAD/NAD-binding protein n=1 Tax=Allobaculum stercoricanis TaxID=174709 RepID=UPI0003700474|nr:sulfide/dihydroorotate dehydrogenase-like FAD/NAD-binding protein [Allobaculum stercoricanis]
MYKILRKKVLNPTVISITVEAPNAARLAKAGQFIILRVDEEGERVPFTIADANPQEGTVTIIYQVVGASTRKLMALNEGDYLADFAGPLGKPSEIEGENVVIIGGGVGCAIALPTAKAFHQAGKHVDTIVGFRNKDLVILEDEFKAVSDHYYLMSDDGSVGEKGLVTQKLEELIQSGQKIDKVIAIGPLIMMKFVCQLTKQYDIPTVVSMNPIMIDGTGMCGGCRLMVDGKMKFACVDGPDFDGHLVDFDAAMSRNRQYFEKERHDYEATCNLLNKKEEN